MRVLITGAGGYLGTALTKVLRDRGHYVTGTTSSAERAAASKLSLLRFGEPVPPTLFRRIEVVVHAAQDLAPGGGPRTVAGTVPIAEAAAAAGVAHQVLISSYSAHPGAVTEYGLAKQALEAWFVPHGHSVVRPGLVVGKGGMFGRMVAMVRKQPVVPMIYPRGRLVVVGERDCLACLAHAVEHRGADLIGAWLEQRTSMQELLEATRAAMGARTVLFPVPWPVALSGAWLAELLGVPVPLGTDTLRAMRANARAVERGHLSRIVTQPQTLEEMIADAIH